MLFHLVICATHCFAETLMDTVVQKNVNPIPQVERSMLLLAKTVHDEVQDEYHNVLLLCTIW